MGAVHLGGAGLTILVCVVSISFATVLALSAPLAAFPRTRSPTRSPRCTCRWSAARRCSSRSTSSTSRCRSSGSSCPRIAGGIIALGFNYGAYMTEIFRAGIQAVPRGQREAAEALGMPERLVMRRIVLPQAIRIVIPAIGNEFIAMIKDSRSSRSSASRSSCAAPSASGRQNFRTPGGAPDRGARVLGPDHHLQLLPGAPGAAPGTGRPMIRCARRDRQRPSVDVVDRGLRRSRSTSATTTSCAAWTSRSASARR